MILLDAEANYWASVTAWGTWFAAFGTITATIVALFFGLRDILIKPQLNLNLMSIHESKAELSFEDLSGRAEKVSGMLYLLLLRCTCTKRSFVVSDWGTEVQYSDGSKFKGQSRLTDIEMEDGSKWKIPFDMRLMQGVVFARDTSSLCFLQFFIDKGKGEAFENIEIQIQGIKGSANYSILKDQIDYRNAISITEHMNRVSYLL